MRRSLVLALPVALALPALLVLRRPAPAAPPPPGASAAGGVLPVTDPSLAPTTSAPAPLPGAPDDMVTIPGGHFAMGSVARKAEPNESPVREVTVRTFRLDRTEVTTGAYLACVQDGRCAPLAAPESRHCTGPRGPSSLPVNCVSFDEADHYCRVHAKRLPTEAEWERAARGDDGRTFPWGNEQPTCERAVSRQGNVAADGCPGGDGPQPVASRKRAVSPYGVHDLGGNVEEWIADYYDDRHVAETDNPTGAKPTTAHVLRGGSWASPWRNLRSTARSWSSSHERGPTVGFRCARDAG